MSDNRTGEVGKVAKVDAISTMALLSEPVRRALYEHVAGRDEAVDRDEAATATGIGRPLAAFHLDRLVAAGLLEVEYRRRNGRSGPGAGRPAKFYRPTRGLTVELSLPARRYKLAAEIFAEGLDRRPDGLARDQVRAVARERGAALGRNAATRQRADSNRAGARRSRPDLRAHLVGLLEAEGFEPQDNGGEIRLRNCPFHVLAAEHRELTCSMNLALLEGVVSGVGDVGLQAVARPADGSCCVRFVPS
jgi:predicted ArsR family transcriptional regulator